MCEKKYVLLAISLDVASFVIKSPKCCLNNAINFFAGADDVLCANGVL